MTAKSRNAERRRLGNGGFGGRPCGSPVAAVYGYDAHPLLEIAEGCGTREMIERHKGSTVRDAVARLRFRLRYENRTMKAKRDSSLRSE